MELSKLSKSVRAKLRAKVLENIFIGNDVVELIEEEFVHSEFKVVYPMDDIYDLSTEDHITLFNNCTKQFLPYIKNIYIENPSSHYYLIELSNSLSNLTSLAIYGSKLSLSGFNTVLNNLQGLENLVIDSVYFIQYSEEGDLAKSVKLHTSLKYLVWKYCYIEKCCLQEDPQLIDFDYDGYINERSTIYFDLDHYPKLNYISTVSRNPPFNIEFLLTNPQINWLDYRLEKLNQDTITIFNAIQNIEILELEVAYLDFNLNSINLQLPNLKRLYMHNVSIKTWSILKKLSLSSPNLIELYFDITGYVLPPILDTINSILSLKKLTITSQNSMYFHFDDFSVSKSLEYFELCFEINIDLALSILEKYPNLNTFCIHDKYFDRGYILTVDQENTTKPWILTKMGELIKYNKI
ncbi:hypothetical protein CONCODRAFT_78728, partial [Conidiobolus coronatus NRRL 28638]